MRAVHKQVSDEKARDKIASNGNEKGVINKACGEKPPIDNESSSDSDTDEEKDVKEACEDSGVGVSVTKEQNQKS